MDHTKIDTAELNFSCQEFSVRSLGFVLALLFFRIFIFHVCVLGEQSNCS